MNNDKELLEWAAKAAGTNLYPKFGYWNPLTDDGDALRLAVKLDMQVEYLEFTGKARARSRAYGHGSDRDWCEEYCMTDMQLKDPYAATRRAIVRAAAEIGKGMK